jgi:hypothetical protein
MDAKVNSWPERSAGVDSIGLLNIMSQNGRYDWSFQIRVISGRRTPCSPPKVRRLSKIHPLTSTNLPETTRDGWVPDHQSVHREISVRMTPSRTRNHSKSIFSE